MKALSIHQPWAQLIALGKKTVELRSWKTKYRGDFLVCASKGDVIMPEGIARGGVGLCIVELFEVRRTIPSDLIPSAVPEGSDFDDIKLDYAWLLRNVRPVLPFPVKGQLNFFSVEDDLIQPLPDEYANHFAYLRAISYTPKYIRKRD